MSGDGDARGRKLLMDMTLADYALRMATDVHIRLNMDARVSSTEELDFAGDCRYKAFLRYKRCEKRYNDYEETHSE